MAGRTWRDLRRRPTNTTEANSTLGGTFRQPVAQQSPRLTNLLEQRQALENRLKTLTSGTGETLNARDAARFQVPTFAERQRQQREWEAQREALQARALEVRTQARDLNYPNNLNNLDNSRRVDTPDRSTTFSRRTGRDNLASSATEPVNQWLARRDMQRRSLRDAARERLSPLNDVADVGNQIKSSLSRASGQLRDLDRQLAANNLNEERSELRRLGSDKLTKATSQVDKYTKMAEAPMRMVKKIDSFWESRQNKISGAMDQTGSYFDRSQRRLSTDSGGSGDLFERMQRNRMQALKRRQEQRRQEERDEARRERARRNSSKGD